MILKYWKRVALGLALLSLVSCALFLGKNSRAGVESPAYSVERTDGSYQIRSYGARQLVRTPMSGEAKNGSFMRLFRYITGANASSQEIAMTTPVIIDRRAEQQSMSFILPAAVQSTGAPQPKSTDVALSSLPPGRVAVHQFSGKDTPATEAAATQLLLAWVKAQGLRTSGALYFAYYDPPWTPTALRRNEVHQPLK
jgi:DNA gyrase inhibitor GyrI